MAAVRLLAVEGHMVLANRIGEDLPGAGLAADVACDSAAGLEGSASTG